MIPGARPTRPAAAPPCRVIEELGERNQSLVVKEADVERAKLQRTAAISQFENDEIRKTLQAETDRAKRLIDAQSTVNITSAKRTAALTEASTDQKRIEVELDTKVLKAQKSREADILRANATAESTLIRAHGDAAGASARLPPRRVRVARRCLTAALAPPQSSSSCAPPSSSSTRAWPTRAR